MAQSDMDKLYGAGIRQGVPFTCPHCRVCVRWVDVPEMAQHVSACLAIEVGLLEQAYEPVVSVADRLRWYGGQGPAASGFSAPPSL